jgi:uncharacterized Zn finger protein
VKIAGRKIATTFWGAAWCDNLERYSDFANRIPRGRTYVRNGSVIDLQIGAGQVDALVSGSDLYDVAVKVAPVPARQWKDIRARCAGGIDSLVELLQGRFSKGVMGHLCQQGTGLFPTPREIEFSCSCPDSAYMCKHVAAVLYGVGARLDHRPELLFRLRKVNEEELVASAASGVPLSEKAPAAGKILEDSEVAGVFGVEFAPAAAEPAAVPRVSAPSPKPRAAAGPARTSAARGRTPEAHPRGVVAPSAPKSPPVGKEHAKKRPKRKPKVAHAKQATKSARPAKITAAERRAISERMRRYWEERRRRD